MKKRILLFLILCLCFSMQGCKSVDSLLKEGKYEEAYSFSKTEDEKIKVIDKMLEDKMYKEAYNISMSEEEKLKVINQMFSDNKYDDAMELLAEDYDKFDEEKKKVRLDLFMDKITVKSKVKKISKKIVYEAYGAFNENKQYTKAWLTMCMFGASDTTSIAYIDRLVQEGVYVELITECADKSSNEYREKYNWIGNNLIPYLRDFVKDQYISNNRESERQMRINALSSIKSISVMYKYDRYAGEYGPRENIFNSSFTKDHPIMSFCIGNTQFICDYYGKVFDFYDNISNGKIENGVRWSIPNVSSYEVNRYIINITNMSPILYANQVTNAYFEVISGDQMVDKAIEYLINQIK